MLPFFAYEASNIICKKCNRENSLTAIWNHHWSQWSEFMGESGKEILESEARISYVYAPYSVRKRCCFDRPG